MHFKPNRRAVVLDLAGSAMAAPALAQQKGHEHHGGMYESLKQVRGKIFCMGGEGTNRVYGQNEAYDIASDTWESYAPMMTPRHGLGAVAIGDTIYVAGGGPVMGGGFQSAINEAFVLG